MDYELIYFKRHLSALLESSDRVLSLTLGALSNLEATKNKVECQLSEFFKEMNVKSIRLNNLNATISQFESATNILKDIIEKDDAAASAATSNHLHHHHLSVSDHIDYLKRIKSIETFTWLGQLDFFANYSLRMKAKLRIGDMRLANEFNETLANYSQKQHMKDFIEHLMNRFDQGSEPELLELNPNSSKFFISIEALNKLEKICSWFIEREKEYELYATINYSNSLQHEHDDSIEQQHCDINQVLNYYEIRRPFLDFTIKAYSKLNSLVSIKTFSSEKLKKTLNKLFQLTDDNATAIDWRPHVIISDETATITTKLDEEETNSADSLNKSSSSLSASSLSASFKSKPVECIETFADNLDFGLRLLTHETQMLKFIYRNSTDTFNDLSSKFAVLIIEQIQKEFEEFLTNICDFTKTCNSGADVIYSLMILLIKVQHLKEKTNCLPREDLMTASKFLGFTMRLNEISAQIFSAFIDVVKRGHFMEFSIPENSSLHESTLRTCHFLNKLIENQEYLNEILKIVYETKLIKLTGGGLKHEQQQKHEQEHVEEQQDEEEKKEVEWLMALEKEEGEETAVNNNEPHPDNLQHHHHHKLSSYLKLKFKRLKNKINHDSASITGSMESLPTDSFYLAAYTQAIVDKHKEYLIEETQKTLHETSLLYNHQKLNIKKFLSNGSRSNANRFKSIQNEFLKSYLFLVNNLEHTVDQLANNQSAIYETIKVDVDVQFESSFNQLIQDYLDKSCEAYRLLERKWLKLLNNRDEEQQQHQFHLKFHHHQNLALKKTRKLDSFMKLLRETLQVSMGTAIKKPETNQIFKQVVIHYLDPILSSIGDDHLNDDWVKTVLINEKHKNRMLLLNHQTKNDIPPLKSLIYERMFPS